MTPHREPTIDGRIPPRDDCVLRHVLERWCRERPIDDEDILFVGNDHERHFEQQPA